MIFRKLPGNPTTWTTTNFPLIRDQKSRMIHDHWCASRYTPGVEKFAPDAPKPRSQVTLNLRSTPTASTGHSTRCTANLVDLIYVPGLLGCQDDQKEILPLLLDITSH